MWRLVSSSHPTGLKGINDLANTRKPLACSGSLSYSCQLRTSYHRLKPNQRKGSRKPCFSSHLIQFTLSASAFDWWNLNHKPRSKAFWEMYLVTLRLCGVGNHYTEAKIYAESVDLPTHHTSFPVNCCFRMVLIPVPPVLQLF